MTTRRATTILPTLLALVSGLVFTAYSNTPPVASFEVLPSDGGTTTVLLDASGSHDPDGAISAYQWTFGDGFSGSGQVKTHTYPSASTYTITLLVIDNGGATHLLTRMVDLSRPLEAPSAEAPADDPGPAPQPAVVAANVAVGTWVGARAPEFALRRPNGEVVRLSDHLGSVVLVEFWSSGCPACRAAMPHLEELRAEYAARGLVVIDIITNQQTAEATQFLAANGYTQFIDLLEADPIAKPTMHLYNVSRVPHAFLIDRTGVIRFNGHFNLLQDGLIEAWL